MRESFHPLVKQLLDGELSLAELPPELRHEGEAALRLLGAVDRAPVSLSTTLDQRVMAEVRRRSGARPQRGVWRRLVEPHEIELRLRIRPWVAWGGALAAAAVALLFVTRPPAPQRAGPTAEVAARDSVYVRFMLYAPEARHVTVAGTFNQWDRDAAPLVPAGTSGVWTTTLALPVGQHQYAFVVDGKRWVADPAAPGVNDGFGRRNSLVAVMVRGARTL